MKNKKGIGISILLVILGILCIASIGNMTRRQETLEIQYFYNNPCGSCDGEETFYEIFNQEVGDLKDEVDYHITSYNTFQASDLKVFEQTCGNLQIDVEERNIPMLIVGERILVGDQAIEEGMREAFVGQEEATTIGKEAHLIYFYTQSCKDCERTKELFKHNQAIQKELISLIALDIGEKESLEQLKAYFKAYQVKSVDQQVPIIFYEGGYLSGYEAIEQELPKLIQQDQLDSSIALVQGVPIESFTYKDIPKIVLVGLVNGFNPCAFSMTFFLLSLMSIGKPILKLSMTYIIGKIITYFALGTLFYSFMGILEQEWFIGVTQSVNMVIIGILFILAAVNFLDYRASKQEQYDRIRLQLPLGLRRFNHKVIKGAGQFIDTKYAVGAIFIASMIISAGEFLCTGQIYLATILYLIQTTAAHDSFALLTLLIYVLAMVTPLTVVVIAVCRGQKVMLFSEKFRMNMPKVKLVNAIVFILLALLMIRLL
ncbi:MAG: hypothetical protein RSF92_12060 [Niameybacter sp.]|uniref:cytochrome c biogenesis CcdA family protein n=1 Tax=Niameybacter sp. TaxID=2033640 RepID=UPI002FCAB73D